MEDKLMKLTNLTILLIGFMLLVSSVGAEDKSINKDHFIINEDGTINLSNLNNNTLFFKKSKFINNFIVVRLQYDNIEQYGIDIKFLNVTATKSDR